MCRYSKAHAMQSSIDLSLIKPYWLVWIALVNTLWSLEARIFVRSLTLEFRRDIGLKSPILDGLSFFGTNTMWELFMLCMQMFSS
jgi:hypothetical protein